MKENTSMRKRGILIGIIAIGALIILTRTVLHGSDAATDKGPPPVLVETVSAQHADVPIYLQGLGTVQAFYTVTVTARVDGELQKVAFNEGQSVKRGDLLAQIDPRPNQAAYTQALAQKAKDAASLANARRDLERYTLLQPQDLASKQTVDTARASVDQLTAQVQIDQAVIDNARTQLDYTRIVSPINGRTGIRLVDPGNIVHASDPNGIVVVTQLQPISVVFTLSQENLPAVSAALAQGKVQVTTLSRDGGQVLDEGTLMLIDNQISTATGTAKLKATFDNANNTLWPGQYVAARVLIKTEHDALTVPSAAVQRGPDGPYAYVVKSDSTVEARPLKIGEDTNGITIIKSGLDPAEHVVTTNQYRLQPGARVQMADAAAGGRPQAKKAS